MSEKNERQNREGALRRSAETAADFALGGASVAVEKGLDAVEELSRRGQKAARKGERAVREKTAEAARAARGRIEEPDARPYEERTRDELYQLAVEREIEGRSAMSKSDLIAALRAER